MQDPTTHFQPWVGDQYETSKLMGGKRVMLLGESHYEWLDGQTLGINATQNSIENGIAGKKQRFRTRVAATFLGHLPIIDSERHDFWHSIVFANYVPVSVGRGANAEPTEEMWEAGVARFAELIKTHTPDFLVVLGHALWQRMHYTFVMDGHAERHQNAVNEWRTWRYRYANGKSLFACATKHPSRNYNYKHWHPFIREMLVKA